jgi:hypothetical protein
MTLVSLDFAAEETEIVVVVALPDRVIPASGSERSDSGDPVAPAPTPTQIASDKGEADSAVPAPLRRPHHWGQRATCVAQMCVTELMVGNGDNWHLLRWMDRPKPCSWGGRRARYR